MNGDSDQLLVCPVNPLKLDPINFFICKRLIRDHMSTYIAMTAMLQVLLARETSSIVMSDEEKQSAHRFIELIFGSLT